jgi:hypothetical protein
VHQKRRKKRKGSNSNSVGSSRSLCSPKRRLRQGSRWQGGHVPHLQRWETGDDLQA